MCMSTFLRVYLCEIEKEVHYHCIHLPSSVTAYACVCWGAAPLSGMWYAFLNIVEFQGEMCRGAISH